MALLPPAQFLLPSSARSAGYKPAPGSLPCFTVIPPNKGWSNSQTNLCLSEPDLNLVARIYLAMKHNSVATLSNSQKRCPSHWHLPLKCKFHCPSNPSVVNSKPNSFCTNQVPGVGLPLRFPRLQLLRVFTPTRSISIASQMTPSLTSDLPTLYPAHTKNCQVLPLQSAHSEPHRVYLLSQTQTS